MNNVGVMYEMPMKLSELSQDMIWQHVNINTGSLAMMCWMVLPQMLERRKSGEKKVKTFSSIFRWVVSTVHNHIDIEIYRP